MLQLEGGTAQGYEGWEGMGRMIHWSDAFGFLEGKQSGKLAIGVRRNPEG